MHVVVTRPRADGERTAAALRARGHRILVAPLMEVEAIPADLSGNWASVIVTSANALGAIGKNPARKAMLALPLFAIGRRSAEVARQAGFTDVVTADGDVRDLVRMLVARRIDVSAPLLYLAGEDRAADLMGELSAHGIVAEMRVVYRTAALAFPQELIEAFRRGQVDAVLHFSRRSAENYLAGARQAGIAGPALAVRHFCLSAQVAEPLAGASRIAVAVRPDETALIELLQAPPP